MKTLRALLGTELPLIQAPMAGVQGAALAVAVSQAGGLGSLPGAMLTPEALLAELTALSPWKSRMLLLLSHEGTWAGTVGEKRAMNSRR